MKVEMKDGVGFGLKSQSIFMLNGGKPQDAAKIVTPQDKKEYSNTAEWSNWGDNNDEPTIMKNMIENCGVLNTAADGKARIAVGKGIQPFLLMDIDKDGKEELEWCSNSEIHDWLEANDDYLYSYQLLNNIFGYGWCPSQVITNLKGDKINRIAVTDVYNCRLEKRNTAGEINNLFLAGDWEGISKYDSSKMSKIPILQEGYELEQLMNSNLKKAALLHRFRKNGRQYYPQPLWYAARKWVEISISIPEFKAALNKNQIHLKYLVNISEKYFSRIYTDAVWKKFTPQQRIDAINEKVNKIDEVLAGNQGAGRSIFNFVEFDNIVGKEYKDISIEVIDDKMKDGKMLPDSSAANSEILFAMMINPALWGLGQPGGAYSNNAGGSNVRESHLSQMMLLEPERRLNLKAFNLVKKFNGWDKETEVERTVYGASTNGSTTTLTGGRKVKPRLVFRYPSGILTTLDTGKSTKTENL